MHLHCRLTAGHASVWKLTEEACRCVGVCSHRHGGNLMMNPSPGVGGVYKVSLRMFENFFFPRRLSSSRNTFVFHIIILFDMKLAVSTLLTGSFFHSLVSAIPFTSQLSPLTPRQSCENTATSRNCWGDYSIDTDWYSVTPDTGVTREVREPQKFRS